MNKLFILVALMSFNLKADIKADLKDCHKEKNKRMLELIDGFSQDKQWRDTNKVFLENNRAILLKSSEILPEIKESQEPWALIWSNQEVLKKNAEIKVLFDEHFRLMKIRDEYISQRDSSYKEICLKLEQLREQLAASYKKK